MPLSVKLYIAKYVIINKPVKRRFTKSTREKLHEISVLKSTFIRFFQDKILIQISLFTLTVVVSPVLNSISREICGISQQAYKLLSHLSLG